MDLRTFLTAFVVLIVIVISTLLALSSGVVVERERSSVHEEIPSEDTSAPFSIVSASCSGSVLTVHLRNEGDIPLVGTYFLEVLVDEYPVDSATGTVSIPPGGDMKLRTLVSERACVPGARVRITIAGGTRSTIIKDISKE